MSDSTTRYSLAFISTTLTLVVASGAFAQATINEIRVDQPGLDLSEYVEFKGTPGASLAGLTLVVIGDNDSATAPAQNGTIESVVALSGTVPSNGFFVLAEATFALGLADQVAVLNFENPDDLTFLLVSGFTGADGNDLDTNDDGTLDATPWTAIVDSVAFVQTHTPDGVAADFVYATTHAGPDGASSPAQAWRCANSAAWTVGAADTTAATDSPGAENPTCGSSVAIKISEVRIDQSGNDDDEYFELQGPAGTNLNGYTYIVIGDNNVTGSVDLAGSIESVTPLDGAVIPADGYLLVAKSTMTIAVPDFIVVAAAMNFENSDNVTHVLVSGFTGALNGDVDADNNCAIDAGAPWGALVDSIALTGLDTTCVYSADVAGPDATFTTVHAYRCYPDGTASIGAYNHLAGGDTPGYENRACGLPPVLECGEATAGLCTVAHTNPYCADSVCCTLVCAAVPTCCTVSWDAACAAMATESCNQTGSASCDRGVVAFSEIRIDQTGTDTDEWVELVGAPGTSLADLTMIVIGDAGSTNLSGVIESVTSLAGQVIPADGHFSISEATFTQGLTNIDLVLAGTNPLNFENSDNVTFMLVRGFTGASAQDLDVANDGVLDVTPWSELLDSIALIETTTLPPTGTGWFYGPNTIGPDTTFVPGHIWRCEATGCWNIGLFDIVAAHDDTPGVANLPCASPCAGDYNSDGIRNGSDLATLLSAWGSADGDIDGDGATSGSDLATLLSGWGDCP